MKGSDRAVLAAEDGLEESSAGCNDWIVTDCLGFSATG
jgi:hypothetical protein